MDSNGDICPVHGTPLTKTSGYKVDGFFSADVSDKELRYREKMAPNALELSESLKKHWIYTVPAEVTYCEQCEEAILSR